MADRCSVRAGMPKRRSNAHDIPVPKNTNGLSRKKSRMKSKATVSVSVDESAGPLLGIVPPNRLFPDIGGGLGPAYFQAIQQVWSQPQVGINGFQHQF